MLTADDDDSSLLFGWHRIGCIGEVMFISEAPPATMHSWSRLRGDSFGDILAELCCSLCSKCVVLHYLPLREVATPLASLDRGAG